MACEHYGRHRVACAESRFQRIKEHFPVCPKFSTILADEASVFLKFIRAVDRNGGLCLVLYYAIWAPFYTALIPFSCTVIFM